MPLPCNVVFWLPPLQPGVPGTKTLCPRFGSWKPLTQGLIGVPPHQFQMLVDCQDSFSPAGFGGIPGCKSETDR